MIKLVGTILGSGLIILGLLGFLLSFEMYKEVTRFAIMNMTNLISAGVGYFIIKDSLLKK